MQHASPAVLQQVLAVGVQLVQLLEGQSGTLQQSHQRLGQLHHFVLRIIPAVLTHPVGKETPIRGLHGPSHQVGQRAVVLHGELVCVRPLSGLLPRPLQQQRLRGVGQPGRVRSAAPRPTGGVSRRGLRIETAWTGGQAVIGVGEQEGGIGHGGGCLLLESKNLG